MENLARNEGMRSLRDDALRRLINKTLTLDEMDRVIDHEIQLEATEG